MPRRHARIPRWLLGTVAAVVLATSGALHGQPSRPARLSAPAPALPLPEEALTLLLSLPVKGRAPLTGYRRSEYGEPWADVDHNGCRTRDDILTRDLTDRRYRDRCVVVAGTLLDPYTHEVVTFRKAEADAVQVDHVVALADAWQTGARQWTAATRLAFANDPRELLAVGREVNEQKGGSDAASWLPPYRAGRCAFVTRQVQVKAAYRLWVTPAEREAIRRVLAGCR